LPACAGFTGPGNWKPDSVDPVLTIITDKEIYYSNETLKVHIDFNSTDEGKGQLTVSGIKNEFGRALVNESRDESFTKVTTDLISNSRPHPARNAQRFHPAYMPLTQL